MRKLLSAVLSFAAAALMLTPACAAVNSVRRVAILPFAYTEEGKPYTKEGPNEPPAKGREVLETVFGKAGCAVVSDAETLAAWRSLVGSTGGGLPEDQVLLKLGQRMGVDLVCAGKVNWHIRTPVTITGPKTKALCTVEMKLVNVKTAQLEISPKPPVQYSSDRKLKSGELAIFVLVYPYTWFSGGPKTPQMEKSLVFGLGTALEPWLHRNTTGSVKIATGKTSRAR